MFRKLLAVTVLSCAGSIALSDGAATADSSSSTLPTIARPPVWAPPVGRCVSAFAAAGVGGADGLQYEIEGVAASTNPNTVATQVECKFYDLDTNSDIAVFRSGYMSGPAAALAEVYTVHTLDTFVTCVKVDTFDSYGNIDSTPWTTTDNQPC